MTAHDDSGGTTHDDSGGTTRNDSGGTGGGVHISNSQGAFAIGRGNRATQTTTGGAQPRDPAQEELLRAVREFRADLARLVANDQTTVLDAELADAEDEIAQSGAAGQGRLARLRQALTDAGAVTALVASGAGVAQA
ncbi:hypothetical protein P8605_40035, partial [Streptomyces sp. T-3]|nr:hypothetical protein [Streptomyces sp. T-3]